MPAEGVEGSSYSLCQVDTLRRVHNMSASSFCRHVGEASEMEATLLTKLHVSLVRAFPFHPRGGSLTDGYRDSSRPPSASSSRSDLVYSNKQQRSWNFDGYSSENDVMLCCCT